VLNLARLDRSKLDLKQNLGEIAEEWKQRQGFEEAKGRYIDV
jgi:hypothetical protein